MTTTTCPKCGKPLRLGARFCGSCGANLPAALARPAAPQAGQAAPTADQAASSPCPKCGRPVRVGARFCSQCGFERVDETAPAASVTVRAERGAGSAQPQITVPNGAPAHSSAAGGVSSHPSAPVVAAPPPAPSAVVDRAPGRSRSFWPVVVAVGLVVCVLAAAAGGLYLADPFGWFEAGVPAASAPTATATAVQLQAPLPAATQPAVLPTATAPPTLLPAVTLEPTLMPALPTAAQPISLTETLPPPSNAPPLTTLAEDDFNGQLNLNWLAWGNPWPLIDRGPTDSWLVVKAVEDPLSGGVTSKFEVPAGPGVEVLFSAALDQLYRAAPLFFDWAPVGTEPGPENPEFGVLHFEIHKNNLVLENPPTQQTCMQSGDGLSIHTYMLRFSETGGVALYVDGYPEAACELPDLGIPPRVGKISFTGAGWVTYVRVSTP